MGRTCGGRKESPHKTYKLFCSAVKQSGRQRKGPPEIIQKFRLRKWPISSADFPMTPMERTEHHFGPFWEKDFGQYPAAPSSPGPFGLLLICSEAKTYSQSQKFPRTAPTCFEQSKGSGKFGAPPQNGLLRTLCSFQKVLEGVSVYRVHRNALLVGQLSGLKVRRSKSAAKNPKITNCLIVVFWIVVF